MAMLMITHDLGIVRKMADRVCVMTGGEIVEQGNEEQIFEHPQHPYTRRLLAAEPKGRPSGGAADAPVVMDGDDVKIGRASCRARVSQDVSFSVVAVSLKKKTNHN